MRFEVAYQCEMEQSDFNHANPEPVYCFGDCTLKINRLVHLKVNRYSFEAGGIATP